MAKYQKSEQIYITGHQMSLSCHSNMTKKI